MWSVPEAEKGVLRPGPCLPIPTLSQIENVCIGLTSVVTSVIPQPRVSTFASEGRMPGSEYVVSPRQAD